MDMELLMTRSLYTEGHGNKVIKMALEISYFITNQSNPSTDTGKMENS
jgi:hypothetical protein